MGRRFGGLACAWALNRSRSAVALYMVNAELPGTSEQQEYDNDPHLEACLEKARALQPVCLPVLGGNILFSGGS